METILTQYYQSPYGELLLGSFGDKLCLCDWMLNEKRRVPVDKRIRQALHADYEEGTSEVIARAIIQLDEYFACKRTIFDVFDGNNFDPILSISLWRVAPRLFRR